MTAHFIDPGAAEFMQPELLREKDEGPTVSKRRKYTVEHSSQVQKYVSFLITFGGLHAVFLEIMKISSEETINFCM